MNIYVGNLAYSVTEEQLRALFEDFGTVEASNLVKDRYSGDSKGFGFIEMKRQQDGEAAIKALNGRSLGGRPLTVNIARPPGGKKGPRGRR
tara:strand:+ start:278 stop:550 length:273 start_codon:yes stop_codon:yes gene_type:complete